MWFKKNSKILEIASTQNENIRQIHHQKIHGDFGFHVDFVDDYIIRAKDDEFGNFYSFCESCFNKEVNGE